MAIKIEAATRLVAQSKATPFGEGYNYAFDKESRFANRYVEGTSMHDDWVRGFNRGISDKKESK